MIEVRKDRDNRERWQPKQTSPYRIWVVVFVPKNSRKYIIAAGEIFQMIQDFVRLEGVLVK